jgi:hypothetical protein
MAMWIRKGIVTMMRRKTKRRKIKRRKMRRRTRMRMMAKNLR